MGGLFRARLVNVKDIMHLLARLIEASDTSAQALWSKGRVHHRLQRLRTPAGSALQARLLAERGERRQAFDLLSPIHGWLSEGFDLPDLKEARTLLDELRT